MHLHPEFLSGYRHAKSFGIAEEAGERPSRILFRSNCGKDRDAQGLGKRILELRALDFELMCNVILGVGT